ncbi:MAG TPA: hypothetical protein VHY20_01685 [Pirellulales bacterium]|jgi:uncharacterized protein involved in exopolysaccharide biosynthesis|nr:hypothetical protein [Pirellulales bacterium]
MTALPVSLASPLDVVRLVRAYPLRWLVPTLVVGLLAAAYAAVRSDRWEASQALIVRNEAAFNSDAPGKFRQPDEMKTLLETVLELSKTHGVLKQALLEVGPPAGVEGDVWPSDADVAQLADNLRITPPKGAEFGKTEVFYLKVTGTDRSRALALATAVTNQLEARYNALRNARAGSLLAEVTKTVELASADLRIVTSHVQKLEEQVGGDLSELRSLHQAVSGESDLRRKTLELENELRQAQVSERNSRELLDSLVASQRDEEQLLATPSGLLESQPAIKHLKAGLMDAQLRTAELLGTRSLLHPQVVAAKAAEQEIAQHLKHELSAAIRGVQLDWKLGAERVQLLEKQRAGLVGRLERLAGLRAEYSRLLAESDNRTRVLQAAERELVEARAAQASSLSASLISRLDSPDAGLGPVGPGRVKLAAGGILGGLLLGLGLLLVSVQPVQQAPAAPLPRVVPQFRDRAAAGHVLSLKRAFAKSASPLR